MQSILIFEKPLERLFTQIRITNLYFWIAIISPNYYEMIVKTRSLALNCILCMVVLALSLPTIVGSGIVTCLLGASSFRPRAGRKKQFCVKEKLLLSSNWQTKLSLLILGPTGP